jgi:hypothetical protein
MSNRERFICKGTRDDGPRCESYARVTIRDTTGARVRACCRHAVALLDGVTGAEVVWQDTAGINLYEKMALKMSEERSALGRLF